MVEEIATLVQPEWPARIRFWADRAHAYIALRDGDMEKVGAYLERSLELARACGSETMITRSLANLADHALAVGDLRKAVELGRELMGQTSARRNYHLLVVRGNLANALLQTGEIEEARQTLSRFHEASRAARWDTFGTFSPVFALLAAAEGRMRSAARLLGFARRCNQTMGGMQEVNESRAFELAMKRVASELAPAEVEGLMAEGEGLDEEAVCALTLDPAAKSARALHLVGS